MNATHIYMNILTHASKCDPKLVGAMEQQGVQLTVLC